MLLFIKGLVVGIGKIIPGVSGAMLAVNFNVYEDAIDAISNFFNDPYKNIKFILKFGLGIIISIIIGSKLILYLLTNYKFLTMMFFIGLIMGGVYNFKKRIRYTKRNKYLIVIIAGVFLILSLDIINTDYNFKNNFFDNIILFMSGFIDMMASIVPGISGTSLLMMMGVYDKILNLISMIFNVSYVMDNIGLYLSYGIGMFLSFISVTILMNYLLKKYRNTTYVVILGLSIGSIIYLIIIIFKIKFKVIEFVLGIMLLVLGLLISSILDK